MIRSVVASMLGLAIAVAGTVQAEEKAKDPPKKEKTQVIERTFSLGDGGSGSVKIIVGGPEGIQLAPEGIAVSTAAAELKLPDRWIGVGCGPVPEAVRAQLALPEKQGLIVLSVHDDSPAKKAGLKEHDVLIKAGDQKLTEVADLLKAVEAAKDKKMPVELLRGGKKMKIDVEPAKRPENLMTGGVLQLVEPDLQKMIEEAQKGVQKPLRFQMFGPGAILPPGAALPGNLSVTIERSGSDPAKITVKRGDEKWEITEKELDKLPPDVRMHVAPMVHGAWGGLGWGAQRPSHRMEMKPSEEPSVKPGPAPDRRIEELQHKIQDLQRAVDELRKENAPKKPAKKI